LRIFGDVGAFTGFLCILTCNTKYPNWGHYRLLDAAGPVKQFMLPPDLRMLTLEESRVT
jgi:hypothetical protein